MLPIQFKRGTTAQNDAYTGRAGSISVDTELNTLRVHDGSTAGGFVVSDAANIDAIIARLDALAITDVAGLEDALADLVQSSTLGQANGVATLDGTGKVPAIQLPSFVDDVVEAANFAALPGSGEAGKIYITLDNNKVFRWGGSTYVEIVAAPGSTDSITEGSTNLYFLASRARAAISVSGDLAYNSTTGVLSYTAPVVDATSIGLGNVQNYGVATQAEAEAATATNKYLTPQGARYFIEALGFVEDGGEWTLDQGELPPA